MQEHFSPPCAKRVAAASHRMPAGASGGPRTDGGRERGREGHGGPSGSGSRSRPGHPTPAAREGSNHARRQIRMGAAGRPGAPPWTPSWIKPSAVSPARSDSANAVLQVSARPWERTVVLKTVALMPPQRGRNEYFRTGGRIILMSRLWSRSAPIRSTFREGTASAVPESNFMSAEVETSGRSQPRAVERAGAILPASGLVPARFVPSLRRTRNLLPASGARATSAYLQNARGHASRRTLTVMPPFVPTRRSRRGGVTHGLAEPSPIRARAHGREAPGTGGDRYPQYGA